MNKVPELISAADRRARYDPAIFAEAQFAVSALINGDVALPETRDMKKITGLDTYIPTGTFNALVAWLDPKGYKLTQHQRTERHGSGYGGDPYNTHVWTLTVDYN